MDFTMLDVLQGARKLIADTGWCQKHGLVRGPNGVVTAYCSLGAIGSIWPPDAKPSILPNMPREQHDGAMLHLRKAAGDPDSILAWNDEEGRTKEEVLATFDKAIESAKAALTKWA